MSNWGFQGDFFIDQDSEIIAASWGVDADILKSLSWRVEAERNKDENSDRYFVIFSVFSDAEKLLTVIPDGGFSRELDALAFKKIKNNRGESSAGCTRDRRSYYIDGDRFTPSQFRRLSRSRKLEGMIQWFYENYEDPALHTPYESREGGYQWIWGGPYDASDEIGSEFSDLVSEDIIEEAVEEVTSEGIFDWAPVDRVDDRFNEYEHSEGIYSLDEPLPDLMDLDDDFEDDADIASDPSAAQASASKIKEENSKNINSNSDNFQSIKNLRGELLQNLDDLEAILNDYNENLPHRSHNNPPELVEPEPISHGEIIIVIAISNDLRAEAQLPHPRPEVLLNKASVLREVATSIMSWIARKVDLGVDSAIKWSVPITGAWLLPYSEKVHATLVAVIDTVVAFALALGG